MKKSPLFWKVSTLIGCILLLLVPLFMVTNLISERASYRETWKIRYDKVPAGRSRSPGRLSPSR